MEVLSDVAVFNESKDKSIISDLNGNVDLELFSNWSSFKFVKEASTLPFNKIFIPSEFLPSNVINSPDENNLTFA